MLKLEFVKGEAVRRVDDGNGAAAGRGHCRVVDLDYAEDSTAETDANFVITGKGGLVEIQGTAEREPFSEQQFLAMLNLAKQGCAELSALQKKVLGI